MPKSLKFIKSLIQRLKEKDAKRNLTCRYITTHQEWLDKDDGVIIMERYHGDCERKVIKSKRR